jgi:uncharacterized membrane protein YcaP (DUF421 family)
MSMTGAVLAVGTFALLTVAFSWLVYRVRAVRPLLDASPLIVLQDGRPVEKNLRHERVTLDEVAAEARQQGISSLDEVRWAVLEGNGRISFIRR